MRTVVAFFPLCPTFHLGKSAGIATVQKWRVTLPHATVSFRGLSRADFEPLALLTFDKRIGQAVIAKSFRFRVEDDTTLQPHRDVYRVADIQHPVVRQHV